MLPLWADETTETGFHEYWQQNNLIRSRKKKQEGTGGFPAEAAAGGGSGGGRRGGAIRLLQGSGVTRAEDFGEAEEKRGEISTSSTVAAVPQVRDGFGWRNPGRPF
jgi:hypothetical protein